MKLVAKSLVGHTFSYFQHFLHVASMEKYNKEKGEGDSLLVATLLFCVLSMCFTM